MPYYSFECNHCNKGCELLMKYEDIDKINNKPCNDCNQGTIQQIMGTPTFKLKGSGFYNPGIFIPNLRKIFSNNNKE